MNRTKLQFSDHSALGTSLFSWWTRRAIDTRKKVKMNIVAFCIYLQYVQGLYFNPHQPQYSEAVPFQAYFPSRIFEVSLFKSIRFSWHFRKFVVFQNITPWFQEQQFSPAFFPDELLELENELSKFDLDNGQRSVLQQQSLCGLIKPMCPILKKSCSICKKFLSVKSCKKICQTSKKYCNSSLSCDGEPALEEITGKIFAVDQYLRLGLGWGTQYLARVRSGHSKPWH